MVRLTLKPSLREASCWILLVVKGAGGNWRRSFFSTERTDPFALKTAKWSVRSVEKKERRQFPPAPFTTSKIQQDASRKLGFNVKRTMGVAQRLYEGIDLGAEGTTGLITYMRTDSPRVAPDAIEG